MDTIDILKIPTIMVKDLLLTGNEGLFKIPVYFKRNLVYGASKVNYIYRAMLIMDIIGRPIDIVSVSDFIIDEMTPFNPVYNQFKRSDIDNIIERGELYEKELREKGILIEDLYIKRGLTIKEALCQKV